MNREEFENSLLYKNVTDIYLNMSNEELEEKFGSDFMKTVNFGKQNNSSHQYELFEHILRTVDSVEENNLSKEDLLKVKIAAFFHDIGKPQVAQINEKTGQTQYIGHAKESANMAKNILEKLGYSEYEINELNFLIQSHDDFIPIAKKEDVTPERISKITVSISKKTENYEPTISDYKKLITLCKADAMAQNTIIEKNGEIVDTKEDRIARLEVIEDVLPEAIVLKQENEISKLKKQKETTQNGPEPIEKNGKIVNQKQIDMWNGLTEEEKQIKINEIDEKINIMEKEKAVLLETYHEKKAENLENSKNISQSLDLEISELDKQNTRDKE